MRLFSRYLLVALVAVVAALAALWVAQRLPIAHDSSGGRLHEIMHKELRLDAVQENQIEVLESSFAQRRKALDAELALANRQLADAVATEHAYGPAVERAVDRSHMAMGDLQKATLSHVFAMRAVLRPNQAEVFDKAVSRALTAAPQD